MSKQFCRYYESLWIGYDPFESKINVFKCCLKREPRDLIKSYTISEFRSIPDLYEELSSLVNTWPETFDKETYGPFCHGLEDCFWDKPVELKRIEVSLQTQCNANCQFCGAKYVQNTVKEKKEGPLLKELYFETLNKLKGHNMKSVRLTELGEPLFFKKETIEFCKSLTKADFSEDVIVTTNGILLDDEYFEAFKNCEVTVHPMISLNAWDRESYKRIMGVDAWDRVIENLYKVKDILNFKCVNFTYQSKEDYLEIKKMVEKLTQDGFWCHIQPDNHNYDELLKCLED